MSRIRSDVVAAWRPQAVGLGNGALECELGLLLLNAARGLAGLSRCLARALLVSRLTPPARRAEIGAASCPIGVVGLLFIGVLRYNIHAARRTARGAVGRVQGGSS
eukprot:scaffold71750_cov30-Tisochrysis_lutea.AAC.3